MFYIMPSTLSVTLSLEGHGKLVHIVDQGSVLLSADQR